MLDERSTVRNFDPPLEIQSDITGSPAILGEPSLGDFFALTQAEATNYVTI
jgi:hypothetical protein